MTANRVVAALVGVVAIAIVVLITLPDAQPAGVPDADGVLEIVMDTYRFAPDELWVEADTPVQLRFVNRDAATHDISIGREVVETDAQQQVGFVEDLLADLEPIVSPPRALIDLPEPYQGTAVRVPGGATVTVDISVPEAYAGAWEVGCFTARGCHYRSGLSATLTIE
jgi:hypothetical protein